jgi:hypothetical protein
MPTSYPVEGTLRLGTSYLYAPGKTVDLSFGVGLTPDTPNLRFSVGFAFRRSLWNLKGGRCRNRLVGGQSSGWGVASHEERVEGNVLEETDLEADSDDLTKIGRCRESTARSWISRRNSIVLGERVLRSSTHPPQSAKARVRVGRSPWRSS